MPVTSQQLNVFKGQTAVEKFLNPDFHPYLPLVELPECCNPYVKNRVRIFAKLLNFLPLQNVKSLPALQMLEEAKESGRLNNVHTIVENSSGNTVFSLATIARQFGITRTRAIVSHEVNAGKLNLLRLFGTEIVVNEEPICPDPEDRSSGIYKAKQLGKRPGWLNPGQYDNQANPRSHERWTGPQIWEQTEGRITLFAAGLGTTGTMVGIGGYLKKKKKEMHTIGVTRSPNNPVPGVRTKGLLRQIAFDWRSTTDYLEEVGTVDAYAESLNVCRAGIMAGPSSGFALKGLLQFLAKEQSAQNLDNFRNEDGEVVAVFICPDSPLPYLEDYFTYLDDSFFPKIEHEHLLLNHKDAVKKIIEAGSLSARNEITPLQAAKALYVKDSSNTKKYVTKKGVLILDVRGEQDFLHAHVPGAQHVEFQDLSQRKTKGLKSLKGKHVFLFCAQGYKTKFLAALLREQGIKAISVQGGMIEWSRLNLPRVVTETCQTMNKKSRS